MNINNRQKLINIMAKEELTSKEVAKLVKRSEKTVFSWRSDRNVPHWVIPYLRGKISKLQR
jgi:DNA-binding XRE family transcriptional regulator